MYSYWSFLIFFPTEVDFKRLRDCSNNPLIEYIVFSHRNETPNEFIVGYVRLMFNQDHVYDLFTDHTWLKPLLNREAADRYIHERGEVQTHGDYNELDLIDIIIN